MNDATGGQRPENIERLFFEALEKPVEQRSAFLDDACTGDQELKRRVECLLEADGEGGPRIDTAPWTPDHAALRLSPPSSDTKLGDRIGVYRLRRLLGIGGMGEVWFAERSDGQFEQYVAVKLIKRGMDSVEILARFRQERQVLAHLNHPNVAKLLDGGATENQLPYIVMEYVDGRPIDRFCDERRLTVGQRLELFLKVCDAVHYAHTNLVVHRDLKPSNVLVTDAGEPKLLDFGIAKVLSPEASPESLSVTVTGQRLLTPRYASPEQVRGEPVSTVTDVYALGVMLFELLTGSLPYGRDTSSHHEMERQILDTLPTRPSGSVAHANAATRGRPEDQPNKPTLWAVRSTNPARLRRSLRGDLDTIILKALCKEPSERYASAEQFAEDIRRHREGLPLLARRAGMMRRGVRALRRNRRSLIVATIATTFALAVTGTALTYWFMAPGWAREHVREAHLTLLKPSHFSKTVWNVVFYDGNAWHKRGRRAEVDLPTVQAALAAYTNALRLNPLSEHVRHEADTLRLAVALASEPHTDPTISESFRKAAPLTCRLASDYIAEGMVREILDEELDSATAADLRCLGLLYMLCGNMSTTLRVWTHLDDFEADPLIEALMGMLYLVLDRAELAYPRLLSTYRQYPESGVLCTYLADAAVQCGDVALAKRLLDRATTMKDSDGFGGLPRVRMLYYLATGQDELAEEVIRSNMLFISNPVAVVQYARQLADRGELRKAMTVFVPECGLDSQDNLAWRKTQEFLDLTERWWAGMDEAKRLEEIRATLGGSDPKDPASFVALLRAYHHSALRLTNHLGQEATAWSMSKRHAPSAVKAQARAELLVLYDRMGIEDYYRWAHIERYPPSRSSLQTPAWTSPIPPWFSGRVAEVLEDGRDPIGTGVDPPLHYQKLLPVSGRGEFAGSFVDIDGDTALVCSHSEAFTYHRAPDGWILEQRMAFSECRVQCRVEGVLDGNRLLLVRRKGDAEYEAASIWERFPGNQPWRLVADLMPAIQELNPRPRLGRATLSGDVALISVFRILQDGSLELSILVFRRDPVTCGWQQEAELPLVPGDPGATVSCIAADGNLVVVGVQGESEAHPVHVYRYDVGAATWRKEAEIQLSKGGDQIMASVWSAACDDDVLVVGATTSGCGEVYVYRRDPASGTWTLETRLSEFLPAQSPKRGRWGAIDGDQISVQTIDWYPMRTADWHMFELDRKDKSWSYRRAIREQDSGFGDFFGGQFAFSGNTLIVGAPNHDAAGIDAGAAYIFDLP